MTLEKNQKGEQVICMVKGRIDTQTSPDFQNEIQKIFDNGAKQFILDFQDVNYLSSAGLRVILEMQKKISSMENGSMEIINTNEDVYEVFEMTGFTDFIPISEIDDDEDDDEDEE